MASMPTEQAVTHPLDADATNELFIRAARHGAEVTLYADAERSAVLLNGAVVDCCDSHLFFCVHCENATELAMNALGHLYADLLLDGTVYQLVAEDLEDVTFGNERLVRIPRPKTVLRMERRRTRRHQFQAARFVDLCGSKASAGATLRGRLLNLSPDGFACRMSHADAMLLSDYEHLTVSFTIAADQPIVTVTGRIVSRTPAGTHGHTVVGIEFDDMSDAEQRARITEMLKDAYDTKSQDDQS